MQFVTWSLGDALPAEKRRQLAAEREAWIQRHPKPWPPDVEAEYHETFTERIQNWLDAGSGSCSLRDPQNANTVASTLLDFNGTRFHLDSLVVMPNHVHVLVTPTPGESLSELLRCWKGCSARQINQRLGQQGALWMKDYWDRIIRDRDHYHEVRRYIAQNPAKAHLPPGSYFLWQRDISL